MTRNMFTSLPVNYTFCDMEGVQQKVSIEESAKPQTEGSDTANRSYSRAALGCGGACFVLSLLLSLMVAYALVDGLGPPDKHEATLLGFQIVLFVVIATVIGTLIGSKLS